MPGLSQPSTDLSPEFAQQILQQMLNSGIAVTPKSFHVWFDYAIGWHPELAIAIDAHQRRDEPITTELCESLYDKYIDTENTQQALAETQDNTQILLQTIMQDVVDAGGAASIYGQELNAVSDVLRDAKESGRVRDVVTTLVGETAKMANSSRELQAKLENATNDVELLRRRLDELERESLTDPLTGLHNRKALKRRMASCFIDHSRDGISFSVIMIDIDHFKEFNDKYGHHIGDAVLRIVSATLSGTGHPHGQAHRFGGEEFSIVLPGAELDTALDVAERYRSTVESKRLKVAKTSEAIEPITISAGVCEVRIDDNEDSIMQRADRALYLAKECGRNAVKSERDLDMAEST